ncbi:ATP-binding cassette sub-family C member 4-like [Schistocerca piceifrons]|uniref:ATP-binding cassette sub-family C member 4-like n=1 Tax=Schistocerca piceifrons TaxID=274613 RepID=UPI001F5E6D2C|nr:ATP-binding cassette sub-family C member 4-like [Schistocerca piceifrons]XP_047107184.1 ATP-binding cassette sub-family C member 4-like [Schistocerca piceifrons]
MRKPEEKEVSAAAGGGRRLKSTGAMDSKVYKSNPNPKATANPISKLFVWWMRRTVWKQTLTEDDLFDRLDSDATEELADRLQKSWDEELTRAKQKHSKPSFAMAIFRTFWLRYFIYGVFELFDQLILRVAQPLLLGFTIQYFNPGSTITEEQAYIYASLMVLINFLKLFCHHHYTMLTTYVGMRVRVACCALLYRKVLRINKQSMDVTATGQVINLMSNDVARFDVASLYANWLWMAFLQLALITYFLYRSVSWAAFAGVVYVIIMTVPPQTYMGKLSARFRKRVAVRTDERMRMMNELVQGIQVVKMYAWERPFDKLVALARKSEIHKLLHAAYLKSFLLASAVFIERSSLLVTLVAYFLMGYTAGPDQIFSMSQYYNVLNVALAIMFPMGIAAIQEARVSVRRIQEFLLKPEATVEDRNLGATTGEVSLEHISATWDGLNPSLSSINLHVSPGKLCAIVGPVGCGKSSLLYLLINELTPTCGKLKIGGKVSYASQEPWIFVGTVRQNILFGQPYDRKKYKRVVEVCALSKDFELLPFGDQTLVGEKGITLSGGQRARVNLARAVYREADVYLLDDPLSAVDTHVGKHLFDECINSYLSGKTRILVTHQLQYLQGADSIMILNKGNVECQGTFEDILRSGVSFSKLVSSAEEETETEDFGIKRSISRRKSMQDEQSKLRRSIRIGSQRANVNVLQRQISTLSEVSLIMDETGKIHKDPAEQDNSEKMMGEKFQWQTVSQYFRSAGGLCLLFSVASMIVIAQIITSGSDYVVTYWSNTEVLRTSLQMHLEAAGGSNQTLSEELASLPPSEFFLELYGGLVVGCILLTQIRSVAFFNMCMRASRNLHNKMFSCILRAPMRFFDTNPSGRILNRFSKDMGSTDELLPQFTIMMIQIYLVLCGILAMVLVVNYILIVPMVIVGALFVYVARLFMTTGRNVKRLEGIRRSPVFSHLSDTLNGLSTIRASGIQDIVMKEFDSYQDRHTSAWFLYVTNGSALGIWLDFLSSIFVAIVTYSFLVLSGGSFGGSGVGLAISQSLILTGMLQYGIMQMTEVVSQMTSVERVLDYTKIPSEAALDSAPDKKPPASWPQRGQVTFQKMYLKYSPEDPPVLKNLNFTVQATHKVGIVGRTGAGKSSLISALFRLAPIEGAILIDDVDTSTLGLHDLRKHISIIPQEPVLFSETLRFNLDPFSEFDDAKLWDVLEEVKLKSSIQTLDFQVTEGGSNFSVGQRQLVCLARAILRNNRILVLDEATANVDPETDALIQATIRRKFKHCTVLTIAHRLNTIMDSDKVLVMDAGTMVEYDHPHILLRNPTGFLSKLVQETGYAMAEQLRNVAKQSYNELHGMQEGLVEGQTTKL